MGYFQVRYNSRVIIYDGRGFIRLATGLQFYMIGFDKLRKYAFIYLYVVKQLNLV